MAKCLNFSLGGVVHSATPVKVDRKKLYGWSETKAFDEEGHECMLASTDESGSVIIPKGERVWESFPRICSGWNGAASRR
ncbi:hypothetical protein FACS1894109_16980 [Spirochaetia bacterium]|nr:hypothetical protein FACS1894109_16980 [Spirochaetia bacterium]